jgi:hypothetical protein
MNVRAWPGMSPIAKRPAWAGNACSVADATWTGLGPREGRDRVGRELVFCRLADTACFRPTNSCVIRSHAPTPQPAMCLAAPSSTHGETSMPNTTRRPPSAVPAVPAAPLPPTVPFSRPTCASSRCRPDSLVPWLRSPCTVSQGQMAALSRSLTQARPRCRPRQERKYRHRTSLGRWRSPREAGGGRSGPN